MLLQYTCYYSAYVTAVHMLLQYAYYPSTHIANIDVSEHLNF